MATFFGWNLINNKLVPYKLFLVSTQSCFTSQPWITSSSKRAKFSTLKFNMKWWYFQNTKFRFALDLDLRTDMVLQLLLQHLGGRHDAGAWACPGANIMANASLCTHFRNSHDRDQWFWPLSINFCFSSSLLYGCGFGVSPQVWARPAAGHNASKHSNFEKPNHYQEKQRVPPHDA